MVRVNLGIARSKVCTAHNQPAPNIYVVESKTSNERMKALCTDYFGRIAAYRDSAPAEVSFPGRYGFKVWKAFYVVKTNDRIQINLDVDSNDLLLLIRNKHRTTIAGRLIV